MNSNYLINQVRLLKGNNKFLIADEVHSTGSNKISEGLSATPKRWLDDEGTNRIIVYFKGVVFDKISLYDAIYKLGVLCEYNYHLIPIILDDEELQEYKNLTKTQV